jgi:hypothetical protein
MIMKAEQNKVIINILFVISTLPVTVDIASKIYTIVTR